MGAGWDVLARWQAQTTTSFFRTQPFISSKSRIHATTFDSLGVKKFNHHSPPCLIVRWRFIVPISWTGSAGLPWRPRSSRWSPPISICILITIQALTSILIDGELSRRCLRAIKRITGHTGLLPTSYAIPSHHLKKTAVLPFASGRFASVSFSTSTRQYAEISSSPRSGKGPCMTVKFESKPWRLIMSATLQS